MRREDAQISARRYEPGCPILSWCAKAMWTGSGCWWFDLDLVDRGARMVRAMAESFEVLARIPIVEDVKAACQMSFKGHPNHAPTLPQHFF